MKTAWRQLDSGEVKRGRRRASHACRAACRPRRGLQVESLENRCLLSGTPLWNDTNQLTLSFAPDGTDLGGQPSQLFAAMNQVARERTWEEAVLRAFQTWMHHTTLNLGVVADGGQPFGTPGPRTQDPRFGDIRVGARPLVDSSLAIAVAQHSVVAGTWAGDVIFNSQMPLTSVDDLFAVALHEAGHVLGLAESADPLSPMHSHGLPTATELTREDIRQIQELHGQRQSDPFEGWRGNNSPSTATPLPPSLAGKESSSTLIYGDITTRDDVDYFALPSSRRMTGPLTIRLQTKGISLMAPSLRVVTVDGREVSHADSQQLGGTTLRVRVDDGLREEPYFIEVRSARDDLFGIGAYSLIVGPEKPLVADARRLDDLAVGRLRDLDPAELQRWVGDKDHLLERDLQWDDTLQDAAPLAVTRGFLSPTRFDAVGSVGPAGDVDYYRLDTLTLGEADPRILNLTVRSLSPGLLIPRATVLNQRRVPVETEILVNGNGEFVLQARLEPQQRYFVRVESADSTRSSAVGNYQLQLALVDTWINLKVFAQGAVGGETPLHAERLHVAQPQLLHLVLEAADLENGRPQALLAQLLDPDDQQRTQLAAPLGETRSAQGLLLLPGTYTVLLWTQLLDGDASEPVRFRLRGTSASDPFGVDPEDPTETPIFACPDEPDVYCYPGGIRSEDPFIWDEFLDSLPEVPDLDLPELIETLLGDWWSWYWQQQGYNPADFNEDLVVDQADITELSQAIHSPFPSLAYDLDQDGTVGQQDLLFLVEQILGTSVGDVDLDGWFDSRDLVLVFQAGQYEDAQTGNSTWLSGDWDGDREFVSSDLAFAFQRGGYTATVASVPALASAEVQPAARLTAIAESRDLAGWLDELRGSSGAVEPYPDAWMAFLTPEQRKKTTTRQNAR